MVDICIIGGGAAGMIAAVAAKESNPSVKVAIIEKKSSLGKKLLATGNGKCNISNINCIGHGPVLDFFSNIGIETRTDSEGRIYPYTEEARVVVDSLVNSLKKYGVEVIDNKAVTEIEKTENNNFVVKMEKFQLEAKKVLIATGGKAAPEFGTSGDGYKWARTFGHNITKLMPILTGVETEENFEKFAGNRIKGLVSLYYKGEIIFQEAGEIQFTKEGLSGICIFNLSRFLVIPDGKSFEDGFDDYRISIDFYTGEYDELVELLRKRVTNDNLGREDILCCIVRKPFAEDILHRAEIKDNKAKEQDIPRIATLVKNWTVGVKRVKGWKFAQATKGGIELSEINTDTMESRLCRGLYFAGEIIDFDGPCGGYNLENAWETGIKAGRAMADV